MPKADIQNDYERSGNTAAERGKITLPLVTINHDHSTTQMCVGSEFGEGDGSERQSVSVAVVLQHSGYGIF